MLNFPSRDSMIRRHTVLCIMNASVPSLYTKVHLVEWKGFLTLCAVFGWGGFVLVQEDICEKLWLFSVCTIVTYHRGEIVMKSLVNWVIRSWQWDITSTKSPSYMKSWGSGADRLIGDSVIHQCNTHEPFEKESQAFTFWNSSSFGF